MGERTTQEQRRYTRGAWPQRYPSHTLSDCFMNWFTLAHQCFSSA